MKNKSTTDESLADEGPVVPSSDRPTKMGPLEKPMLPGGVTEGEKHFWLTILRGALMMNERGEWQHNPKPLDPKLQLELADLLERIWSKQKGGRPQKANGTLYRRTNENLKAFGYRQLIQQEADERRSRGETFRMDDIEEEIAERHGISRRQLQTRMKLQKPKKKNPEV